MTNIVSLPNLGSEFDIGVLVASKISVVNAADTVKGKVALSVGANYPADNTSSNDVDATTPLYVKNAIAAAKTALRPSDFGAVGTADDTAVFQAFLNALRDGGSGDWTGTYNIQMDVLILQPSSVSADTTAPNIFGTVTFNALGTANGPALKIWNATQPGTSGGTYYINGSFGPVKLTDSYTAGSMRYALSVSGTWTSNFGPVNNYGGKGGCVVIPARTVAGNPDFYTVAFNNFFALNTNRCGNIAWNNLNGVGSGGNKIQFINVSNNYPVAAGLPENGAYYDGGEANQVDLISVQGSGWAINLPGPGSPPRFIFGMMELDICENGIWIGGLSKARLGPIRINPRFNSITANSWPRIFLKLGGVGALSDIDMDIVIRIDPGQGLTTANMGTLLDCSSSPNLTNVTVRFTVIDAAGTGFASQATSVLVKNLPAIAGIRVIVNDQVIVDQRPQAAASVRASTSSDVTIPASGWAGPGCKLTGWTVINDATGMWGSSAQTFTVKSAGLYRVWINIQVPTGAAVDQVSPGSTIKTGVFFIQASTSSIGVIAVKYISASAVNGVTCISQYSEYYLDVGDQVFLGMTAVPSSGTPKLSVILAPNSDNVFGISKIDRSF